jgi:hypothetical protein
LTTLQQALNKYVSIKDLADMSHYTCEGVCLKCGWHTLQLDRNQALELMRLHVQSHWRDVAYVLK